MALPTCECLAGEYPGWKALGPIVAAARTWAGEPPDLGCYAGIPLGEQLSALYCAVFAVAGGAVPVPPATLLALFYIPEIVEEFTRPVAAGYSGNGDPSPWQREAAIDVLRTGEFVGSLMCVILENDPTPCFLVPPGPPDVTPGVEKFSAEWTAIPITVSLQKYQYRIDAMGWVDNGVSLTLVDIAAAAGIHTLSVRAVSTSGSVGDVATSAPFEVDASPSGPVAADNFDSYANFSPLISEPNWADVSGDQIYTFNPSGISGVAYSAISGGENRLVRNIAEVSANQYAFTTITGAMSGAANAIGPSVRVSDVADSGYFLVLFAVDGNLYLVRKTAGTDVVVASAAKAYSSGVKIRLEATGSGASTRLSVLEDTGSGFVPVVSLTNIDPGGTYFDSGFSGMVGFGTGLGIVDADYWECGNL